HAEGGSNETGSQAERAANQRTGIAPTIAGLRRQTRGPEVVRAGRAPRPRHASWGEGGVHGEHGRLDRSGTSVRGPGCEGGRAVGAGEQQARTADRRVTAEDCPAQVFATLALLGRVGTLRFPLISPRSIPNAKPGLSLRCAASSEPKRSP